MKKAIILLIIVVTVVYSYAQEVETGIPDSVKNVSLPGASGSYTISNPLVHDGVGFINPPISSTCNIDCRSNYLYFYDCDINVPLFASRAGHQNPLWCMSIFGVCPVGHLHALCPSCARRREKNGTFPFNND